MKFLWNRNKRIAIILHVLVWLIVFSLPYLLRSNYDENKKPDPDNSQFILLNSITGIFWVFAFYFNAFVLVPKLIYPKKYFLYSLCIVSLFVVIISIHVTLFVLLINFHPLHMKGSIAYNLPTFILTIAVSTTYKMLTDRTKLEMLDLEKHEQNLKTEVSFLRSQISPHFIFNVLNNMVALIRMKSEKLEPTVMKLSSLLQYMLYETDEEKVPVKNEIEYLQNYIDLQEQRFGSKLKMNISLKEPDKNFQIEPMLLIPFVENAFKHGFGMIENPQIDIDLYLKDNKLYFMVRNKYNEQKNEIKDRTSGIGLNNVTRRLSLLYPDRHSLLIKKDGNYFEVSLTIILN